MIVRFGDPAPAPSSSSSSIAAGVALGLVPLLVVGVAFWAVLGKGPDIRTSYRGRKH